MDETSDETDRELGVEFARVYGAAPSSDCWCSSNFFRQDLIELLRALPDALGPEAVRERVYAAEVDRGIAGQPSEGTGAEALLIVHGLGSERDHAAITSQLGLEPVVRRSDAWVFGTRGRVRSEDSADHFAALLDLLRPRLGALREISQDRSVEVIVRVAAGLPGRYARYWEFLGAVRELGAGLDFEMRS